ncbi:MAG: MFS transporter [bacterium]|nr:MFS transporter [bacterium]
MALSMVPGPIIGILSRFFIDDLGLTRTEMGAVATGHAFVIMAASLPLGYLADRISGRWMLVLMLSFVFLGLMTMSFSWSLWSLFVFAGLAGLPSGGGNSATNNIIVENVPPGARGWITGIKQAGVQMGVFLAGALLPAMAQALGWRRALALWSLMALVGIGFTLAIVPARPVRRPGKEALEAGGPVPRAVWWVSVYGVTMGIGMGAFFAFLPLYAQERVGVSVGLAGMVVAVSGVSGVGARMVWGRIAERAGDPIKPLIGVGLLGIGAVALVWAGSYSALLMWFGSGLMGIGPGAWMSVGMFAAISMAGPNRTGTGTAMVMLGFGLGLTIGPVIFGWAVDTTGSYDIPLAAVLLNFAASVLLMLAWRSRKARLAV